jgi:hypothetical protein
MNAPDKLLIIACASLASERASYGIFTHSLHFLPLPLRKQLLNRSSSNKHTYRERVDWQGSGQAQVSWDKQGCDTSQL